MKNIFTKRANLKRTQRLGIVFVLLGVATAGVGIYINMYVLMILGTVLIALGGTLFVIRKNSMIENIVDLIFEALFWV